ncbi:MAG TPA: HAD family hydrolase [Solirubrobacteraceae bacterium]
MARATLLDVDGTLVDTNYHHALAWARALARCDLRPPLWRIHRAIGMGGDHLVAALCGDEAEEQHGDAVREAEKELYGELIGEVRPLRGARELIVALRDAGKTVVLASSAKPEEVAHYVELLDAGDLVDGITDAGDVDQTKPDPDIVCGALECAGVSPDEAIFVGDSRWDCEAAARAEVACVAVMTGGFGADELTGAGAAEVFEDLAALARYLT